MLEIIIATTKLLMYGKGGKTEVSFINVSCFKTRINYFLLSDLMNICYRQVLEYHTVFHKYIQLLSVNQKLFQNV